MTRSVALALATGIGLAASLYTCASTTATAGPLSYELPRETIEFKPGPNLDVVKNNCLACHSADYIATQPRGPKFGKDFWQAEVNKMIGAYGAQIDEADIGKIVDYLAATY
ncbi:sulfite dehydrogenase (cytochrome) subunit SorB [Nitrobacter winogradskyi Nb-255]|uniref:Sulfite dehydrogenase (Cytochrome) subunit SorB n=1 Tax=Nitrobacter winogradskyi (strain ATCC 25391 / DSM 10237 / CIP 104748 / NCIMB 11846 / Nb-255) TaxID=323098 RepID=Q3SN68_NITWN|nr:cytochrome c [Nitrobacter winogradskyi]ABA06273.1 sulfite dehydrogenase (cytochrome) subunit SorB [Nitrobacter winogradskyi Nb-255]